MQRTLLKSKLHQARVTQAELHYEGSIAVDSELLAAADIHPYERVDIYNITNGERFSTYAIVGASGSGEICVNGAAARRVQPGDMIIIASYAQYSEAESARHAPRVLVVDETNCIREERRVSDFIGPGATGDDVETGGAVTGARWAGEADKAREPRSGNDSRKAMGVDR